MNYACKFCIAMKGLAGKDIGSLPATVEAVIKHIEEVHRYMIVKEGETLAKARRRFIGMYGVEPKSVREIFPNLQCDPLTLRVLAMQIRKCAWIKASRL